jgi:hypothetical protein
MGVLTTANPASAESNGRVTDILAATTPGPLDLVGTAWVLEPERDQGVMEPTLRGVAPDPDRPAGLIVGREAIDLEIGGPPGSQVSWSASGGSVAESEIGVDGIARVRLFEAAGPTAEDGSPMSASVWVVTPSGRAYHATWRIRVFRQPPSLGIAEELPFLDFAPVVEGQTLAGSTMTVNGVPASVDDDGSFSVPVDVGITPTELRLVVTDPVGNQSERVISRVWPLDYRQLPWVPIAVFALLTVAGLLYVWEPEARSRRRTPGEEEESTFEEIGG